jgi:hypothetical protein
MLLKDVLRYIFRLDSKLLLTVRMLVRPGFLTREYLAGRRDRYERPFRLYVVLTVLSFLALGAVPHSLMETRMAYGLGEGLKGLREGQMATARARARAAGQTEGSAPLPDVHEPSRTVRRFEAALSPGPEVVQARIRTAWLAYGPKLMLLLIPGFAAALTLLYRRRDWRYAERFVFALHYQAFGTLLQVAPQLLGSMALVQGVHVVDAAYLLVAMKRVYGEGWGRTSLCWLLALVMMSLLTSVAVVGVALYAVFPGPGTPVLE